jgi:hypothetical protein
MAVAQSSARADYVLELSVNLTSRTTSACLRCMCPLAGTRARLIRSPMDSVAYRACGGGPRTRPSIYTNCIYSSASVWQGVSHGDTACPFGYTARSCGHTAQALSETQPMASSPTPLKATHIQLLLVWLRVVDAGCRTDRYSPWLIDAVRSPTVLAGPVKNVHAGSGPSPCTLQRLCPLEYEL